MVVQDIADLLPKRTDNALMLCDAKHALFEKIGCGIDGHCRQQELENRGVAVD